MRTVDLLLCGCIQFRTSLLMLPFHVLIYIRIFNFASKLITIRQLPVWYHKIGNDNIQLVSYLCIIYEKLTDINLHIHKLVIELFVKQYSNFVFGTKFAIVHLFNL